MAKTQMTRKPMTARSKGAITLVILLALVVFVSCLSVGGMKLDSEGVNILLPWVPVSAENWPDSLPLARNLGGGHYVEYTAKADENADLAQEAQKAAGIIRERLVMRGVTDAKVTVKEDNGLRIEMPKMDADELNAALAMAVAPAKFEFSFNGEVFMTGDHIKEAGVGYADQNGTSFAVALTTTEEGKQLLADATSAHIGEQMTLTCDGVTLISAGVNEAFTTGQISVPLGLEYVETAEVAIQMSTGSFALALTGSQNGTLENSGAALTAVLIAVAVVLAAALVYAVVTGKLTGVAAMLMAWCAIMLEFFFFATLVLATIDVAVLVVLVLGVVLALYAALVRTRAIAGQIADGNAPRTAVKVGLRSVAKHIWLVHGVALALSLILMIFSFSQIVGYTLCAAVVASALVPPVMRMFLGCFVAMSSKPALYGKVK